LFGANPNLASYINNLILKSNKKIKDKKDLEGDSTSKKSNSNSIKDMDEKQKKSKILTKQKSNDFKVMPIFTPILEELKEEEERNESSPRRSPMPTIVNNNNRPSDIGDPSNLYKNNQLDVVSDIDTVKKPSQFNIKAQVAISNSELNQEPNEETDEQENIKISKDLKKDLDRFNKAMTEIRNKVEMFNNK